MFGDGYIQCRPSKEDIWSLRGNQPAMRAVYIWYCYMIGGSSKIHQSTLKGVQKQNLR